MSEQAPRVESVADVRSLTKDQTPTLEPKPRIWAFHCPFRKEGSPVLGSFGATIRPVVIMPMETWTRLCQQIPELGAMQFDVGSED